MLAALIGPAFSPIDAAAPAIYDAGLNDMEDAPHDESEDVTERREGQEGDD